MYVCSYSVGDGAEWNLKEDWGVDYWQSVKEKIIGKTVYKTPKQEVRIIWERQNSYLVGCHVDSVRNKSNERWEIGEGLGDQKLKWRQGDLRKHIGIK